MTTIIDDNVHIASNIICCNLFAFYAVTQFRRSTVTMSAESVGGSTPGVRVTWSTTAPPECVVSVRVVFRRSTHGSEVTAYTTNNTSGTQVIQSPLQCATQYYIRVLVVAESRLGGIQLQSIQKRIVVGGKENVCLRLQLAQLNPLTTNDDYSFHQNSAACYQLAQSALKIGSGLAERVEQGELGGCTRLGDSAWRLLQLAVEKSWSAPGGPFVCFSCTNRRRKHSFHLVRTPFLAF